MNKELTSRKKKNHTEIEKKKVTLKVRLSEKRSGLGTVPIYYLHQCF